MFFGLSSKNIQLHGSLLEREREIFFVECEIFSSSDVQSSSSNVLVALSFSLVTHSCNYLFLFFCPRLLFGARLALVITRAMGVHLVRGQRELCAGASAISHEMLR